MARIPKFALTWQKQFTPNSHMSGCISLVSQAIAEWFISDPEKIKIIAQCSFYLDPDLKVLTIDCSSSALALVKPLTEEMGQSMLELGVTLIRLTCETELISQFSPHDAIYVQQLQKSKLYRQEVDTD
jgi:hypothetical protein